MITGISQADEQAMTAFLSASDVASGLDSLKKYSDEHKVQFLMVLIHLRFLEEVS